MPTGVYPRTKEQLEALAGYRAKGQRVAWSLPRSESQMGAIRRNLELTRDRYSSGRYTPSRKVCATGSRLLRHTHHAQANGYCELCGDHCFTLQDHDHQTGNLRGRLCHKCNLMLGLICDNPNVLRKAANYVEKYRVRRFPRMIRFPRLHRKLVLKMKRGGYNLVAGKF